MNRLLLVLLLLPFAGAGCATASPHAAAPTAAPVPSICTVAPSEDESGARTYPIAPEYARLPHLGQVFTALDCGNRNRARQVRGFTDGTYALGVTLAWDMEPPADLTAFLKRNGFSETATGTWRTADPLTLDQLDGLRGFFGDAAADAGFRYEDCVLCG